MTALPPIELRHLRTFLVVAETQNFTRAGERLGLSQPSVSQQVKELETALGAELFLRLGPRVRLTPTGRAFQQRAEFALGKLHEAIVSATDIEGTLGGHLHVGVIPPLDVPWIPRALALLAERHPRLGVSVHEGSSPDIEMRIEAGLSEVGVGILWRASPHLVYEPLRSDRVHLLVPSKHEIARRGSAVVTDLDALRLVLLPPSYLVRQITEEAFRRAGYLPRFLLEVTSIDAVLATVARAQLATLMPLVVLEEREHLGLTAVPVEGLDAPFEFGLMWAGANPSPAASAFGDAMREVTRAKG
jgi:LysR family transcriptional regulator, cyn operon transcriptional activator